jgi:hypothetical protein
MNAKLYTLAHHRPDRSGARQHFYGKLQPMTSATRSKLPLLFGAGVFGVLVAMIEAWAR